jgi:predicted DNA-binding ribbon-helix-helix protein
MLLDLEHGEDLKRQKRQHNTVASCQCCARRLIAVGILLAVDTTATFTVPLPVSSIGSNWLGANGDVLIHYTASMEKPLQSRNIRSVRVGSECTTISLEDEFWEQLRIIAVTRNIAISQLLAEIDRTMRLQAARPGYRRVRTLSAAVRVFVLQALTAPPSDLTALCVRTLSAAARSSSQRRSAAHSSRRASI